MTARITLDVIIPTYNRKGLLRKTLESFAVATVPPTLNVTLIVVDNNTTDGTAEAVADMSAGFPLRLRCVRETKQGLSNARNGGIAAGQGELIGFVDDDEEVEPNWLEVVAREFADSQVDFIGGPYLPNWAMAAPDWLPPGYPAVIGAIPPKQRAVFDDQFKGNLMGGNAVMRRSVFERVGIYTPHLGRSSKGLLSDEDADMLRRIRAAGLHGVYVPDLAIRHYIAPERLTRNYHRRWVYWRAASQGLHDRTSPDPAVAYSFGLQRYRLGMALRGLMAVPLRRLRGRKAESFNGELAAWDLLGFAYGKFFLKIESMYKS